MIVLLAGCCGVKFEEYPGPTGPYQGYYDGQYTQDDENEGDENN